MNMLAKIAYTVCGEGDRWGRRRRRRHETAVEEAQNIRSILQARDECGFTHISAYDQFTFFLILI